MKGPLVSIIVPAYNAAPFLEEAVVSAQAQTHAKIEIIIVDDGSTDRTFEIAAQCARRDSRVVVLQHVSNAGLSATRNSGIRAARGEWVAFMDADDVFLPHKTELQLALWRDDPKTNLLYTNYLNWDGTKDLGLRYKSLEHMPEGDVSRKLFYENQFCPSTVMLRRVELEKLGGFNSALRATEDWDLWLRVAEGGLWARGVWEPQIRYRQWAGNMSKNRKKMASCQIETLELAIARAQSAERRAHYERSLRHARANWEFAEVRPLAEENHGALAAAVWRAWKLRPGRLKWLLWYAAVRWPKALGGGWTARPVHRRLREKW